MRVMVIVKATTNSEAGVMPSDSTLLTEMGNYNEELVKAGIMAAGEGLQPTSKGVRIRFTGSDTSVERGPFPYNEDLVAGFWLWNVKSMDEAIEWARRMPNPYGQDGVVEIRPVMEAEDFGEEFTPEARAQEERLRAELAARK